MSDLKKFDLIAENIARDFLANKISNKNKYFNLSIIVDDCLFGSIFPAINHNDSEGVNILCNYIMSDIKLNNRGTYNVNLDIETNLKVLDNTPGHIIECFKNSITPQLIKLHKELEIWNTKDALTFDIEYFSKTFEISKYVYSSKFVMNFLFLVKIITSEKIINKINQVKKDIESLDVDNLNFDNNIFILKNDYHYKIANYLNKHEIIRIATILMSNFNIEDIELSEPENRLFIKKFNKNIKKLSNDETIFYAISDDKFITYWKKKFNDFGMFIFQEIADSMANKYKYNNDESINKNNAIITLLEMYFPNYFDF